MAKVDSIDLRNRVVAFVAAGQLGHEAAAHLQVSASFVVKLIQAGQERGHVRPKPAGGWRHATLKERRALLLERIEMRSNRHHARTGHRAAEVRGHVHRSRHAVALAASQRLSLQKSIASLRRENFAALLVINEPMNRHIFKA